MFEILKINIYAFSLVGYLIWVILVLNYKFCGFDIYWIIHNTRILYRRYNPNKEKKQSQNCFAKSKISHTFAVHMELRCHFCWLKSEKGIRCESGTIPVAVYLDFHSESLSLLHSLPLVNTGKAQQTG